MRHANRYEQVFYERHGLIRVATVDTHHYRQRAFDVRDGSDVDLNHFVHWRTAEEQKRLEENGRIRRRNGTLHFAGSN